MSWMLPSAIANMCLTLLLVFVYGHLYSSEKKSSFLIWALGWTFFFFKYSVMTIDAQLEASDDASQILFILNQVSSIIGIAIIINGTYSYVNRKAGYLWSIIGLIDIIWAISGTYIGLTPFLIVLPIHLYLFAAFLWIGVLHLRYAIPNNIGGKILGVTFILLGVHKLIHPLFGMSNAFIPLHYASGVFLMTLLLVSILIKYLRKNKLNAEEYVERFQLVYETAPELIVLLNKDGIIIDCNNKITELLGYHKEEVLGQNCYTFFHPDFKETAINTGRNVLAKSVSVKNEYKMLRKDKRLIDVSISTAPILEGIGKCIGTVSIIGDISESKQRSSREAATKSIYSKLNNFIDLKETLTSVLDDIKSISGCEAAGIRLMSGRAYPFFLYYL